MTDRPVASNGVLIICKVDANYGYVFYTNSTNTWTKALDGGTWRDWKSLA